jgi:hypothetical protein
MGSEVSKYGTLVPLTQIPDLIQFGEQNKNYVPSEHSDKYELAIGFDKFFKPDLITLTGRVDFDIIINNLNTGNSLKINGFSGNFPKELTPQMLAAQLATILEITDLLSEDPQKIQSYMN